MGNSQDTPANVVELRLEHPEVPEVWAGESLEFFAVIHSSSDKARRYKAWSEPHIVGLLSDDVITVSIFAAKSKWHFENMQCDEYAELYVPWSVLSGQLQQGVELTFSLGVQRGVHWLGHGASLPDYVDAFYNAYSTTEADPSAPHVKMGVRLVEHFVEGYEGLHEVPGGLMGLIQPTEAQAMPQAATGHCQPHGMPRIPASATSVAGPPGSRQSLVGRSWDAASLMAEYQSINKGNAELEASYKEQVRQLEVKIAQQQERQQDRQPEDPAKVEEAQQALQQRYLEHEALEADCDRLRGAVTTELGPVLELETEAEVDDIVVAKLRIKEQLQLDEINQYRRMLTLLQKQYQKQQKRQQQPQPQQQQLQRPAPPDNEERARSSRPQPQQPRQPQQSPKDAVGTGSESGSPEALRRGARRLREQLRRAEEEKREAEEELRRFQEEQANMDPSNDPNEEVRNLGETLNKELRRSQRRVDSLDGKIQQLRQAVDDIRQEASMTVEDIPSPVRSQHVPSALLTELQEAVQHRQEQVQQMQESEERFRRERDDARKALEAAKVQHSVVESKLRLVRSRRKGIIEATMPHPEVASSSNA